jgi:pyruvate dehydrogenase E2 component (dihydrolipoamide acetyltransferase)
MEYVKRLKASTDFAGVKVTPLLIMAKAMIWAVRRNPTVNSTWTDEEIIVHNFVNFGVAAATPRGLIVPNIKDADQMSMLELAKAIEQLAATAREGRTTPADMANGTITITNIGVFGVDTGTPILNPGEGGQQRNRDSPGDNNRRYLRSPCGRRRRCLALRSRRCLCHRRASTSARLAVIDNRSQ